MTSEEIKALGLRVGDELLATIPVKVVSIQQGAPMLQLATVSRAATFWVEPEEVTAIQRMKPSLPDGWTWDQTNTGPGVIERASGPCGSWATINYEGGIVSHHVLPALVAKALLEVWGRTQ